MRNPGRVGITVLVGAEAPISKVQGNAQDANEGAEDESGTWKVEADGKEVESRGDRNRGTPSPLFL